MIIVRLIIRHYRWKANQAEISAQTLKYAIGRSRYAAAFNSHGLPDLLSQFSRMMIRQV